MKSVKTQMILNFLVRMVGRLGSSNADKIGEWTL